ncbi:MAG: HlyD family type I secretion periplasmic adaptor subunit [Alphaproteobacteria bacterium]
MPDHHTTASLDLHSLGNAQHDKFVRIGGIGMLAAFAIFVLWALLAPLSEGVIAFGTVATDGKRKSVEHLEGGIVLAIHVTEGQRVARGDLLVELDPVQSNASHGVVNTRYLANIARLDRLRAERDGRAQVVFSPLLYSVKNQSEVSEILEEQLAIFVTRAAQRLGQIELLRKKIARFEEQISGLTAQHGAQKNSHQLLQEEYEQAKPLHERGIIDLPRMTGYRRQIVEAQGELGRLDAEIAGARIAQTEAELSILQIEREFREAVSKEILEAQERVLEFSERLNAAQDVLSRTRVLAPTSGRVLDLAVHTIGGVVNPGERLLDIVPDDQALVIEAQVRPQDIDAVWPGQMARVQFAAFNHRRLDTILGEIRTVGADAVADDRNGDDFFPATITIDDTQLEKLVDAKIIPGMPAELMIEAGTVTLWQYLFDPLVSVFDKALAGG